jgi:hypothetical protein
MRNCARSLLCGINLHSEPAPESFFSVKRLKASVLTRAARSSYGCSEHDAQATKHKKTCDHQTEAGYMLIFRGTDWYRRLSA